MTETYSSPEHLSVAAAIDVLVTEAVPKAPVLDEARLRAEYREFDELCGGGMDLARGTVEQVAGFLRRELRHNETVAGYDGNQVVVLDDEACIQLYTSYRGRASAWTVWRTGDGLALCVEGGVSILDE